MKIRQRIDEIARWLRRVITQPRDELTRWQRTTRGMYDLGRHGYRQLRQDRAPQMAAALSYRTLFALVPVLVVAMVLLNSVRGADAFSELAGEIFDDYGLNEIAVVGDAGAEDFVGLGQSLQGLIAQAAGINLAAIGWVARGTTALPRCWLASTC